MWMVDDYNLRKGKAFGSQKKLAFHLKIVQAHLWITKKKQKAWVGKVPEQLCRWQWTLSHFV